MFTFMSKFSHHSIRFTVVSIVILATMVTATIAISLQYHFSKNMAKESASQIFSLSSQKTQFYLQTLDKRAQNITSMFTKFGDFVEGHQVKSSIGPVFAEMLKYNTHFYSVNIGFANGNLYELINLEASPEIRAQIGASFTDRWVTIEVSGEGSNRTRVLRYLYDDFTMRTSRKESSDYNASIRPWYVNAKEEGVSKTGPYMFQHLQSPGLSYSAKIPGSDSVLAIDIALSSIDEYLATRQESNKNSIEKEVYLFKKSGEIISSNQLSKDNVNALNLTKLSLSEAQKKLIASTPPLKVSNETNWAPISFSVSGQPKGYSVEMLSIISQMTGLQFEFINGFTWPDLKQAFNRQNIDILQPIFKTNDNIQQGIYSNPLVNIPFSIITQPNVPVFTHINQLQGKNLAIPKGWSIINIIKQAFPRINIIEYPSSKAVLEAVSQGEVFAGLDNEVIFRYTQKQFFIKNIQYHSAFDFSPANLGSSLHFMLQPSRSDLMAIINLALSKITTEQKTMLKAKWFVSSDNQAQQSTQKKQGVVPYEELIEFATHSTTYEQLVPLVINEAEHFIYLTPVNQSKTEFLAIIVPSDTIFASSNAKIKLSIIITTAYSHASRSPNTI